MRIEENYNGMKNVQYITMENGASYLVYVPDNVSADTAIHVHGRGSLDPSELEELKKWY